MGMFDTIIYEDELPEEIPYDIPVERRIFQSKNMGQEMRTFVLRDGRLLRRHQIMRETDEVDDFFMKLFGHDIPGGPVVYKQEFVRHEYEDSGYHGDVELHHFFELEGEEVEVFLQLEARFTEGEHVWTRLITEENADDYHRPATWERSTSNDDSLHFRQGEPPRPVRRK